MQQSAFSTEGGAEESNRSSVSPTLAGEPRARQSKGLEQPHQTYGTHVEAFCRNLGAKHYSPDEYAKNFKTTWGAQDKAHSLGGGSYGFVELHQDLENDRLVAAKHCKPDVAQDLSEELQMACQCNRHPNITRCLGYVESGGQVQRIVFEAGEQSLRDHWKSKRGLISPEVSQRCLKGLARALEYMHGRQVAHLDITQRNVLLCWSVHGLQAKVMDFGLSKWRKVSGGPLRDFTGDPADEEVSPCGWQVWSHDDTRDMVCTWTYRAPEITLGLPYGFAADVWSLGIIAREVLTGRILWDHLFEEVSPLEYAQLHIGPLTNEMWPGVENARFYQKMIARRADDWASTRFAQPPVARGMNLTRKMLAVPPRLRIRASDAVKDVYLVRDGASTSRFWGKTSAITASRPAPIAAAPLAPALPALGAPRAWRQGAFAYPAPALPTLGGGEVSSAAPAIDGSEGSSAAPAIGGSEASLAAPVAGGSEASPAAPPVAGGSEASPAAPPVVGGSEASLAAPVAGGSEVSPAAPVVGGSQASLAAPVAGGNKASLAAPVGGPKHEAELVCRCKGNCHKRGCGAYGLGVAKGRICGKPLEGNAKACPICQCKDCSRFAHKSDFCYPHQWRLVPLEYQAVRAFGDIFNHHTMPDLDAFVRYVLWDHPVASVLMAQLWCPVAVRHFSLAVSQAGRKAKTATGLYKLFVETLVFVAQLVKTDPSADAAMKETLKNSYEGGAHNKFSPRVLGERMGVLEPIPRGSRRNKHRGQILSFGVNTDLDFWVLGDTAHFAQMLQQLPSDWTFRGCKVERSRHAFQVHEKICQDLARLGSSCPWTRMGDNSVYIRPHVQRKLWFGICNKLSLAQQDVEWKTLPVSQWVDMFPDVKGYVTDSQKHWYNVYYFVRVAPQVPCSMHSCLTCLINYATNPKMMGNSQTFVDAVRHLVDVGNSETEEAQTNHAHLQALAAQLKERRGGVPPTPWMIFKEWWKQHGPADVMGSAASSQSAAGGINGSLAVSQAVGSGAADGTHVLNTKRRRKA